MIKSTKDILIQKFNILQYIDEDSLESLSLSAAKRSLSKGQIIQRDHSECVGVPFVVKGSLRLYESSQNGREMTIYKVPEGDICVLAALCILTDKEYDFSVVAQEDTQIIIVNSSLFKNIVQTNTKFNQYILSLLAEKLIFTLRLHEKIHLTSVDEKLYDYIIENSIDGVLKTTHSIIAQDLGTSRVVISRAVGKLREQKIITTSRNFIKIINK